MRIYPKSSRDEKPDGPSIVPTADPPQVGVTAAMQQRR